jgi:hypothetical protein
VTIYFFPARLTRTRESRFLRRIKAMVVCGDSRARIRTRSGRKASLRSSCLSGALCFLCRVFVSFYTLCVHHLPWDSPSFGNRPISVFYLGFGEVGGGQPGPWFHLGCFTPSHLRYPRTLVWHPGTCKYLLRCIIYKMTWQPNREPAHSSPSPITIPTYALHTGSLDAATGACSFVQHAAYSSS